MFIRFFFFFKEYCKITAIDLSKKRVINADPKAIKQINLIGNLDWEGTMFFIIEEAKETSLDFLLRIVRLL